MASYDEIRLAFRRRAKQVHPDVAGEDAGASFRALREAYEVLTDPTRRASYDRILELDAQMRRVRAQTGPASPKPPSVTLEEERRLTSLTTSQRFGEAERLARVLLEKNPRHVGSFAALAEVAAARGDLEKAAKYYAFAAQYDGRNATYQRKHEQMLDAMQTRMAQSAVAESPTKLKWALGSSGGMLLAMALYVALSPEGPLAPQVGIWWPLGLIGMLAMGGVTLGAGLAAAGLLDRFGAGSGTRSRGAILGVAAGLFFWLAIALYLLIGFTQETFTASLSRLLAACVLVVLVFTVAAGVGGTASPLSVLLFSGNFLYLFALLGWAMADGLRRM